MQKKSKEHAGFRLARATPTRTTGRAYPLTAKFVFTVDRTIVTAFVPLRSSEHGPGARAAAAANFVNIIYCRHRRFSLTGGDDDVNGTVYDEDDGTIAGQN